jgi:hypothetical protein
MVQLADLFSVPEMSLLCNVAEYFERNHIDYHPEILFRDVKVSLMLQDCINITKTKQTPWPLVHKRTIPTE